MRLKHPLYYLTLGFGIGWTVALMLADFLLKSGLSMSGALGATFGGLGLAGLLGLKGLKRGQADSLGLSRLTWLYLLAGTTLIWLTSVTILLLNPDGDYWIHAPMQAQMLLGNFPPRNPYFPEIPYGGHYARDLLGVMVSWCTGISLFAAQIPVAALLQLAAFFNLFLAGLRLGGGQLGGALLSLYVFTGVNAGLRQGWLDTLANNTSLANMHTSLLIFLIVRALFEEISYIEVSVTGILFAGLAWSYETNFVSLTLGFVILAVLTGLKRRLTLRHLKVTLCLMVVAMVTLMLQGGSIGHLIAGKLHANGRVQEKIDTQTQAQNQKVSVTFPKKRLFQIKVVRPGEDLSIAYLTVPVAKKLGLQFEATGYVSIFSPKVWRIHWLSFYLFPLAFAFLWRRFNPMGLAFFSYGLSSFLLPAVVDFGIFEDEVFRWQFAASWGFAGALAVALALWFESAKGRLFTLEEGYLVLAKREGIMAVIVLVTYFNSYPSMDQVSRRTSLLPRLAKGFELPSERDWLLFHPILGMTSADLDVSHQLFNLARPGDKFLTNFREQNFDNMMEEDTLVGLSGVQPLGHSLTLKYEPLGTPPYRQNAMARAYWTSGDEDLLRNSPPRWLYYRSSSPGVRPKESEHVKLVSRAQDEFGEVCLYRATLEPFGHEAAGRDPEASVVSLSGMENLRPEDYRKATIVLKNEGKNRLRGESVLVYRFSGEPNEEGLSQVIRLDVAPGGRQHIPFHFVAPHHAGRHRVEFSLGASQAVAGQFAIEVELGPDLKMLDISPFLASEALKAGRAVGLELEVVNNGTENVDFDGLASLRLDAGERAPVPDDFQPLTLSLRPGERRKMTLYLVAPEKPGTWPLSLKLGSKYSTMKYGLGEMSVVKPAEGEER